jgi:hypothetical protein
VVGNKKISRFSPHIHVQRKCGRRDKAKKVVHKVRTTVTPQIELRTRETEKGEDAFVGRCGDVGV